MAKSVRKKIAPSPNRIIRGSGNILADLELPNAKEQQAKLRLAYAINKIAKHRHMTQVSAAKTLGIPQPKVSLLQNYKLDSFSVERLMVFLTALSHDDISIRKRMTSLAQQRLRWSPRKLAARACSRPSLLMPEAVLARMLPGSADCCNICRTKEQNARMDAFRRISSLPR